MTEEDDEEPLKAPPFYREDWLVLVVVHALRRLEARGLVRGFNFKTDGDDAAILEYGLRIGCSPTRDEVEEILRELWRRPKRERAYLVALVRDEITPRTVGRALLQRKARALARARKRR